MHEAVRDFINFFQFNELLSTDNNNPHKLLGSHLVENGLVICGYYPEAEYMNLVDEDNNYINYMERIYDTGFFAQYFPKKELIRYKFEIKKSDGNLIIIEDPYRFEPLISDVDLYLFGEGTHYEVYEKLGAHPKVIDGIAGTYFAVWAPNARRVSVVGDFNNWDGRINPMRVLQAAGIHEIFIPQVHEGDIYKFEIKTRSGNVFLKTDPYMNQSQYRPETASIVAQIDDYKWEDKDWIKKRSAQDRVEKRRQPLSIYEIHLGSWRKKDNGTIEGFYNYRDIAHEVADYVCDMGYTHVELIGIAEHPFDGSWGYQVTGYFAPTSRYGTPKDFMYFVDHLHSRGIGVFLDWVPAHFPKDAHGLGRFDGECLYEHSDSRRGEHPHWGTYIFDYGRKEVKNFLVANALFWIEKFHVDGLRVDAVASMLYLDYGREHDWLPNIHGGRENLEAIEFLMQTNAILEERNPGTYMIAEESTAWAGVTAPAQMNGLGFLYKWNMGWMHDFLEYMKLDPYFRQYHHHKLTFGMMYAYSENFILVISHDEVVHLKGSMINKMPGEYNEKFSNLRVAYGFMFGHPGKKLLFMGQDFAQWSEWSEERSLDWHLLGEERNYQMQQYVKRLLGLYKEYPAFYVNDNDPIGFEWINCNDAQLSIISFVRRGITHENQLLFVCNFTPVEKRGFNVGVPCEGDYVEILNSDNWEYGGGGLLNHNPITAQEIEQDDRKYSIFIDLPAYGMLVFSFDYVEEELEEEIEVVAKIAEKTLEKDSIVTDNKIKTQSI